MRMALIPVWIFYQQLCPCKKSILYLVYILPSLRPEGKVLKCYMGTAVHFIPNETTKKPTKTTTKKPMTSGYEAGKN